MKVFELINDDDKLIPKETILHVRIDQSAAESFLDAYRGMRQEFGN